MEIVYFFIVALILERCYAYYRRNTGWRREEYEIRRNIPPSGPRQSDTDGTDRYAVYFDDLEEMQTMLKLLKDEGYKVPFYTISSLGDQSWIQFNPAHKEVRILWISEVYDLKFNSPYVLDKATAYLFIRMDYRVKSP